MKRKVDQLDNDNNYTTSTYMADPASTSTSARALRGAAAASTSASAAETKAGGAPHPYEYDLAVIGGGSGGMATAKEAARHGARVVLFDYVKPSPAGTKWGLGGTCVNVGCVPKKLMHYAANLGAALHDAHHFGWQVNVEETKFEWAGLVNNVRNHVRSLNFAYKTGLRSAKVKYINGLAKFQDAHTISYLKRGKEPAETLTTETTLIATGGRPWVPDIPGREHVITSDDIFYLNRTPGKTLLVGAGYIALETAGFLNECGFDTTVAVRSVLLRSFDSDVADKIHEVMVASGTKFRLRTLVNRIDRDEDTGRLVVTFTDRDSQEDSQEEFDTVLYATGRYADTAGLDIASAGLVADSKGKFVTDDQERTNVPHIYAVGDILAGRPELTPVAIKTGELLARRLFAGHIKKMDWDLIPTTVFTPAEYGCVGVSERVAIERHGAEDVVSYLWQWSTLEHQAAHRLKAPLVRENELDSMPPGCMAKLVCLRSQNERVVGFHFVGPNAGEVAQGFALGLRCGATKADFDDMVGIHPTDAEALCTLEVRRSDITCPADWTASGGCGGGKCG